MQIKYSAVLWAVRTPQYKMQVVPNKMKVTPRGKLNADNAMAEYLEDKEIDDHENDIVH